MRSSDLWSDFDTRAGLLIDTNLLVLLVVGTVNGHRIGSFKRTSQYGRSDYQLLLRVMEQFTPLYTLPHVMAEVSNLTDMNGQERQRARQILKDRLETLHEPVIPSVRASQNEHYERLGLVDAAIAVVATEQKCAVLTDDLDIYVGLSRQGAAVLNFAHVQSRYRRI